MKTRHTALFATCQLCGTRDKLPASVANAIRAGNVELVDYICHRCGESEAGKKILSAWPEDEEPELVVDEF